MRKSVLVCLLALAGLALADRGSIPYLPGLSIYEPTQRALIAWDEREELLLLSTDLQAERKARVLEVIPFPAEPAVSKGDIGVFQRANRLMLARLGREYITRGAFGARTGEQSTPGGEATHHEVIGAHDITVTHVLDAAGFITWVEDHLREAGVDAPVIPEILKQTIAEYLREGCTWFVFDTVTLGTEAKTNDVIQYRFKTDSLYYPLKISRTDTGRTTIDLMVVTPQLLRTFPSLPIEQVQPLYPPVQVSAAELKAVSEEIDAFFGHRDGLQLRLWRIQGDLAQFDRDLLARP